MNPFVNANYAEAALDATQRELAALKAIAEQMAAALDSLDGYLFNDNIATPSNCKKALAAYRAWEAKR